MIHKFTAKNIDSIGKVLGAAAKRAGDDVFRIELKNNDENLLLALEIHLGLEANGKQMNMVSVYSYNTFLQLHNCTAFVASDILQQVTFFGKSDNKTSALIVEKAGSCSMYANVDESVLSGDFTQLPEDLMMCGVALSITESMDDDFTF